MWHAKGFLVFKDIAEQSFLTCIIVGFYVIKALSGFDIYQAWNVREQLRCCVFMGAEDCGTWTWVNIGKVLLTPTRTCTLNICWRLFFPSSWTKQKTLTAIRKQKKKKKNGINTGHGRQDIYLPEHVWRQVQHYQVSKVLTKGIFQRVDNLTQTARYDGLDPVLGS